MNKRLIFYYPSEQAVTHTVFCNNKVSMHFEVGELRGGITACKF